MTVRWDPVTELADLRAGLDRVHRDPQDPRPAGVVARDRPGAFGDTMIVRADIPGVSPGEVDIEVEDDILTLCGAHDERVDARALPAPPTRARVRICPTSE